nr:leucine-rich repeat protein [Bacteroides intestinalis]
MKKTLFLVCVAALATACTNEEPTFEQSGNVAKGIVFDTTIEGSTVANTRGELTDNNGKYPFFWYAETDRINLYADNVEGAAENATPVGVVNNWNALSNPALYKATKSASQGQFTAISDENWIKFKNDDKVNVVATYPKTTTATAAVLDAASNKVTSVELNVTGDNKTQTVAFNQIDAPMYSISEGQREENYQSVGERVNLSFKRAFPALRFSSVSGNDQYNDILGTLTSVKVTMKGGSKNGKDLDPTNIAAVSATYNTANMEPAGAYNYCNVPVLTSKAVEATVTLVAPAAWNSEDYLYMSIYPVVRKVDEVQVPEEYTVTYTYNHVTLTKNLESSANWNIENAVYEVADLDIANDFPYIVTNDNRLIVFSGTFSGIENEADKSKIDWNNTTVSKTDIVEIISNVVLTPEELNGLKDFSALESLTLKENTSIPANTFDANLGGKITTLNLPKVTEYNDTQAFSKLTDLNLNAYKFAEDNVYKNFFNNGTKTTLVNLEIEAVESLRPTFGYDRTITFEGYVLKTVALNPTGVALTANAFKNCAALESVTGIVDIANAPSAFEGAGNATTNPTINVLNAIIPNSAFKSANIKDIKMGGIQVVPTEIGEDAFNSNTKIELMDLSAATKIGANAFKGATAFIGTENSATARGVVTINVTNVEDAILSGTAVIRVQFKNATSVGKAVFGANAALKQIKFLKAVTTNETADPNNTFNGLTTGNIDMFVATAQTGVNGLSWSGKDFKSITKEDIAWGE